MWPSVPKKWSFSCGFFAKNHPFDGIRRPDGANLTANSNFPGNFTLDRGPGTSILAIGKLKSWKIPMKTEKKNPKIPDFHPLCAPNPHFDPGNRFYAKNYIYRRSWNPFFLLGNRKVARIRDFMSLFFQVSFPFVDFLLIEKFWASPNKFRTPSIEQHWKVSI